jgi:hypothetical protein
VHKFISVLPAIGKQAIQLLAIMRFYSVIATFS